MANDPALEALAKLLIRNQQFAGAKMVHNAPSTPPSTVQAMPPPPTPPSTVQATPPAAGMGAMVGNGIGAGLPQQQPPPQQAAPPMPPPQMAQPAPGAPPPAPASAMAGGAATMGQPGFWDDLRRQLMQAQAGTLPQRFGQGGEIT